MGEAKRRRAAGQSWQGTLPDAMFVRTARLEVGNIALCGNLLEGTIEAPLEAHAQQARRSTKH